MIIEIAIVQRPTILEAQAGAQEKLVSDYKTVVATNQNAALIRFGADNAAVLKDHLGHSDQWDVKIRAS